MSKYSRKIELAESTTARTGRITDVETNKGYKCIGVLHTSENMQHGIKDETKQTNIKSIKHVLKSKLNSRNKIQATYNYAILVISYTAGIIR